MKNKIKDGILLDSRITIIDERKKGNMILLRLLQLMVIVTGGWSFASILIETFQIPVLFLAINVTLMVASVVLFIMYLFPYYDVVKIFFVALFYSMFFYSRLPRLKNGFYILENLVIEELASYYGYHTLKYKADYTSASLDTTILVIMILIPVVALLGCAVVRSSNINLCSLILLVPVSLCFAFGKIPSERYLLAYVLLMFYLIRSGFTGHSSVGNEQMRFIHAINSRAAVWLSMAGLIVFFLMKLIITPNQYNEVTEIKEIKNDLQSAMYNFSFQEFTEQFTDINLFDKTKTVGGLGGGKLGRTGQVEYNNTEQLRIIVPLQLMPKGIYLKGYVGSEYTGDSWEEHTKENERLFQNIRQLEGVFSPVNQVSQMLDLITENNTLKENSNESIKSSRAIMKRPQFHYYQAKMKVEYLGANPNYLYAPYFTDYRQMEEAKDRLDLYSAPTYKKGSYEFNYNFDLSLVPERWNEEIKLIEHPELLGDYMEYEELYRNYVYQVYTRMPEKGLNRIKEEFSDDKLIEEYTSVPERIDYVKNYLHANTRYSLSPGRLPKDKDFVEYFLYDNRTGYCAHYASAAALMLRAMGVPARYVEGYAVGTQDVKADSMVSEQTILYYSDLSAKEYTVEQVDVIVKDYNAHAWVEVYIDGCGWVPVEFTPGSSVEYNEQIVENLALIGGNLEQKADDQGELTQYKEEVTPTPYVPEPEEVLEKEQQAKGLEQVDKDTKQGLLQNDLLILIALVGAIVTGALVLLFVNLRKKRLIRTTSDYSRRAIYLFSKMQKIIRYSRGIRMHDNLEDYIAKVAKEYSYIEPKEFLCCVELVQKARFGRSMISSEELKKVEDFYQNLYNKVDKKQRFGKRILLRLYIS